MKYVLTICVFAGPVSANPHSVQQTAHALFDRLPTVQVRTDLADACGSGQMSNPNIGYCATANTIYVSDTFAARDQAPYEIAHVLGHAIQVRHGVADVALRAIRSRRSEEAALRGMVTRQVECVAGVLMASAGVPAADLVALFGGEPFTDAHWGRNPINVGPRVTIGLAERQEWYDIGYGAQDFAVCSVGEMSSHLIVDAVRP